MDATNNVSIFWSNDFKYCDSFKQYVVYGQETSTTSFKRIDSLNGYNSKIYVHSNAGSFSNQWRYFIKVEYKCSGLILLLFSDTVSIDKNPPDNIQIDSISVLGKFVALGWKMSTSKDTKGYAIYYVDDNNINVLINKVYGISNTSYIDSVIGNSFLRKERYRIVAFDSCENYSDISLQHNTVFLSISQSFCEKTVELKWNHYESWSDNNREYQVLVSYNNGAFKQYGSVRGDISDFILDTLSDEVNYCFTIRVKNITTNISSTSNEKRLVSDFVDNKSKVYISTVTVEDSAILVKWIIQDASDIQKILLFKGENGKSLKTYKQYLYSGVDNFDEKDYQVDNSKYVYRYKISLENKCNQIIAISNESNSVLLILDEKDIGGTLKWNKYSEWNADVENYIIESFDTEEQIWKFESTVQNDVTIFQSGLEKEKIAGYEKCFMIQANENIGNIYGIKANSLSNEVCITGSPIVYFMNAFVPESKISENRYFGPIGKLINFEKSKLEIFNRWGDLVWEENGIKLGWNGTISEGLAAPSGVYIYKAAIIGKDNKEYFFSGSFTLIR